MKKVLAGLVIALAVAGLVVSGVLAANWFWTGRAYPGYGMPMMRSWRGSDAVGNWLNPEDTGSLPYGCTTSGSSSVYGGMMGGKGYGGMMGGSGYGGMMGGYRGSTANGANVGCPYINPNGGPTTGTRLTLEQAQDNLQDALASDSNLELVEVMEFERNFYGIVMEKDTGRGAMELLVDPYSGTVYPEHGPNMMWNEKYGHMGGWYATSGTALTLDEAKTKAQAALDEDVPGAVVEGMGIEFYGYFTFDYAVEGEIAGMLSVHTSGQTWIHDWHGGFIAEVELDA